MCSSAHDTAKEMMCSLTGMVDDDREYFLHHKGWTRPQDFSDQLAAGAFKLIKRGSCAHDHHMGIITCMNGYRTQDFKKR
jgi:hypothetical protein